MTRSPTIAARLRQAHAALIEELHELGRALDPAHPVAARPRWRRFAEALTHSQHVETEVLFPLLESAAVPRGQLARLRDEHAVAGALVRRGDGELDGGELDRFTDTLQELMLLLYRHTLHEQRLARTRLDARLDEEARTRVLAALALPASPPGDVDGTPDGA